MPVVERGVRATLNPSVGIGPGGVRQRGLGRLVVVAVVSWSHSVERRRAKGVSVVGDGLSCQILGALLSGGRQGL